MGEMKKTEASTWPFGKPSERRALEKSHVGMIHAAAQLIGSANEAERELEDVIEALRARVAELEKAGPQYPYKDIEAERVRQDAQWGGASHDDGHPMLDWLDFIDHQITRARGLPHQIRDRLVKIAALAVAGIESIDRYETAQHWHDQEAAFEAGKP